MKSPLTDHKRLDRKEMKDLKVLVLFTAVYCENHHAGGVQLDPASIGLEGVKLEKRRVCDDCRELLTYAIERRIKCPLEPKPTCKHCHIHCYRPGHREKVREIMRFSGKHLMLRGRLDLVWHYFF